MAETPRTAGDRGTFRRLSIRSADLQLSRLATIMAALSVVFLGVLAAAPLKPYFSEWRVVQTRYNRIAEESGGTPIPVAIQQVWKPSLGIADRCVTCHLGMGAVASPIDGDPLFAAHPPIPHEPSAFGCTVCHGGQGRATTKDAAHGFVTHWDEQLLDRPHQTAGCGTCHRDVPVIRRSELARGQHLVERLDCLSCHKSDGRGRGTAPDLSTMGLRGYRRDWHGFHLAERQKQMSGPWRDSYGDIAPADLEAVERWLPTRVGAPRIVEAQALVFERGCLGCHKVGGWGGEEGPALDGVGRKPVGDLKFSSATGDRTLVNYLRQHFLDPPGVVVGSLMPPLAGSSADADLLTSYVLFLRARSLPPEFMPKGRIRRELLQEPPRSLSGAELFGAFCSGCHGPEGQGRTYGNLDVHFPAIGSADFLDVVPDEFIVRTIQTGRPGRRMPALGAPGGSLGEADVAAIVAYLRTLVPRTPVPDAVAMRDTVRAGTGDAARGQAIYERTCAGCHGSKGEGKSGPALANSGFQQVATPEYVAATVVRGRRASTMPAFGQDGVGYSRMTISEVLDVAAFVTQRLNAGAGQ